MAKSVFALENNLIVYGNYCGFGMKKPANPKYLLRPVDNLDSICMQHDFCYDTISRRNCICDETITRQAKFLVIHGRLSKKQKLIAQAISTIFGINNCRGKPFGAYSNTNLARSRN